MKETGYKYKKYEAPQSYDKNYLRENYQRNLSKAFVTKNFLRR